MRTWHKLALWTMLATATAMIGAFTYLVAWPRAIVHWKLRPIVARVVRENGALRDKEAERKLLEMGVRFAPAIVQMLEDETEDIQFRSSAATALESLFANESAEGALIGPRVASELARILGDSKKPLDIRMNAGEALASMEVNKAALVPKLSAMLEDPISEVRNWTMTVLSDLGPDAAASLPQMLPLLNSDDTSTRFHAARTIPVIDPSRTLDAVETLGDILAHTNLDAQSRWEVLRLLGAFGQAAESAIPALVDALGSVHRLSSAERESRGKSFVEAQRVVHAASWAIAQIDPNSEVARTALGRLIDDSSTDDSTRVLLSKAVQRLDEAAQAQGR